MKKVTLFLVFVLCALTQGWSQSVEIWVDKFHFERGEDIVVHYKNGLGNAKDYVAIAPLGQIIDGTPGHYTTTYSYLDNAGALEGTSTIPGNNMGNAKDGYYWLVYLINDGYENGSVYVPMYYGEKPAIKDGPALSVDEITADATTITFTDDALWRQLIKTVSVDGKELSSEDFLFEEGALYVIKDLTNAKSLTITAYDYNDVVVNFKSTGIDEASLINVTYNDNVLSLNNVKNMKAAKIYAATGEQMASIALTEGNNVISLNEYATGIYFVQLTGAENKVMKLVVKH